MREPKLTSPLVFYWVPLLISFLSLIILYYIVVLYIHYDFLLICITYLYHNSISNSQSIVNPVLNIWRMLISILSDVPQIWEQFSSVVYNLFWYMQVCQYSKTHFSQLLCPWHQHALLECCRNWTVLVLAYLVKGWNTWCSEFVLIQSVN